MFNKRHSGFKGKGQVRTTDGIKKILKQNGHTWEGDGKPPAGYKKCDSCEMHYSGSRIKHHAEYH